MYTDLMVDIETLGTKLNSPIIQIGACPFSLETYELSPERFVRSIIPDLFLRPADWSTFRWWMQQGDEARRSLFDSPVETDLSNALQHLRDFIWRFDVDNLKVWSHGLTFDIAILTQAYEQNNMNVPWNFRMTRDTRTILALADQLHVETIKPERGGVHHDALDDAYHQAEWMCHVFKAINGAMQNV